MIFNGKRIFIFLSAVCLSVCLSVSAARRTPFGVPVLPLLASTLGSRLGSDVACGRQVCFLQPATMLVSPRHPLTSILPRREGQVFEDCPRLGFLSFSCDCGEVVDLGGRMSHDGLLRASRQGARDVTTSYHS